MLFGLGSFRFTVPSFSIEDMEMKTSGRIAEQEVIGSKPITQLLGPSGRTLSLSSTFFPLHMNAAGEGLLTAIEAACEAQTPLPMMLMQGLLGIPQGRWIITEVGNGKSFFAAGGRAQVIKTSIELKQYVSQASGAAIGLFG